MRSISGKTALVLLVVGSASCELFTGPLPPDSRSALPVHGIYTDGEVDLSAAVHWIEGELQVLLYATSSGADTARVATGECNVRVRAFPTQALAEPALWDDHMRDDIACIDIGYEYDILPGDTAVIERRIRERVTDSWPPPRDAHYGVVVIVDDERRLLDGGHVRR